MKARRLVLCLFLSLALIVTFIPITSFADDEGDDGDDVVYGDYAITFDGISTFSTATDEDGDDYYYAQLGHGKISTYYKTYDPNSKCFIAGGDEPNFYFGVECDSGWNVNTIQYSIDGGAKVDVDVYDPVIQPPALTDGKNHAIKVYVTFKQIEVINSVNVTFNAPLCGTVVQGKDWSGSNKQIPQPSITLPSGANYEPSKWDENYGIWLDQNGTFNGTMQGGATYLAEVYLTPKNAAVFNTDKDKCAINVSGGTIIQKRVWEDEVYLMVQVQAAHNYTHVVNKAGLLKNGSQYDQCVGCGATQNYAVIPGWGKYYVKAPKAVAGKKSFTVKWGKQSKANLKKFTGYQVRYSVKKSMAKAKMVKVKKTATSKTIKKLKKKTKYFVQVRTYTKKSGKLFYSKWSPKKTVKTK